jgi:glutamine amidotransferase
MQHIVVIDYGMGNLRSVAKAVEHVAPEARITVSGAAAEVARADRVVFPGQGAARDCMAAIHERGLEDALRTALAGKPFLGICMGLQVLFETSEENGGTDCLGLVRGSVRRFASPLRAADGTALKIPHMGWNNVTQTHAHPLWDGIADGSRFYFVHSYHVVPGDAALVAATSDHGGRFVSALARANLFAVQFHPEKSQQAGLRLLANFVRWNP